MKTERWRTSLHEAAHAVACIALGGRCTGIVLFDDGPDGGFAEIAELLGDRQAFSVAAGVEAESLASQFAVPSTPIVEQPVSINALESMPIFESSPYLAAQLARSADSRRFHDSDARRLALWAVTGREDSPERWAGLIEHAHQVAADIVRHNSAAIVKIAERLFIQGSLGESEILNELAAVDAALNEQEGQSR